MSKLSGSVSGEDSGALHHVESKGKAIITAHRGMGVLDKPRDLLLRDEPFFPENSVSSFREGIRQGSDALECDIHVSRDGVPMIIHGNTLLRYSEYKGNYTGDNERLGETLGNLEDLEIKSNKRGKGKRVTEERVEAKERLSEVKVENFTCSELQNSFSLKDPTPREEGTFRPREQTEIPVLQDLLLLAYEENQQREIEGKPPLKLNIELKGEGSAVASIGAIMTFYAEFPNAKKYVAPENIIFLGRHDREEVAIANSIIKGQPELRGMLWEDLIKEGLENERKKLGDEEFSKEEGRITRELQTQMQEKEERVLDQMARTGISRESGGFERHAKKSLGHSKTNVIFSTRDLFGGDGIVDLRGEDGRPLKDEDGQRIRNEDCDTVVGIRDISREGEEMIHEAFTKYRYNGIDISLYDYTPGVVRAIQQGICDSGMDPNDVCCAVSASGWKGSEKEGSITDPCFAVARTEAIARQINAPVLLKTDEPGIFKTMLEDSRSLDRSKFRFGDDHTWRLKSDLVLFYEGKGVMLEPEQLPTITPQVEDGITKVSSKPPRGMEKHPMFRDGEFKDEVDSIKERLKGAGAILRGSSTPIPNVSQRTSNISRNE